MIKSDQTTSMDCYIKVSERLNSNTLSGIVKDSLTFYEGFKGATNGFIND